MDASAGEAHCLQRLAEVRLARGDRDEALALLRRALPLARWSAISMHLLQRIYGTMVSAARSPAEAVTVVERAEGTLGDSDRCRLLRRHVRRPGCHRRTRTPATSRPPVATSSMAEVVRGQVGGHRLGRRRRRGARPPGQGGGRREESERWIEAAVSRFTTAGQPLDAERCARTAAEWASAVAAGGGRRRHA